MIVVPTTTKNIPVGIIHASWGGSKAEAWTSHDALKTINSFKEELVEFKTLIDLNQKSRDWFNNFESLTMPSSNWDLHLNEIIKGKGIDYLSYYIDDWNRLDLILKNKIKKPDKIIWSQLDKINSIDNQTQTVNFSGLTLFKNNFKIKNLDKSYYLNIQPENNMPWGLWEYDININGKRIASSLLQNNKEDYIYSKSSTDYKINPDYLVLGDNQIIVRIIGLSRLGNISIFSNQELKIEMINKWEYNIIAEEFFQIENYSYPYTSLFFYNNNHIVFFSLRHKPFGCWAWN